MIPKLPKGFSHPMRIGEGAFASVYRVRQQALDRWVALKFINEKDRAKRLDLLKEAKTQAKIKSDCIPQIYDAFEWKNSICLVMQWIKGISLSALTDSSLSARDRYDLAEGFISALENLHSFGFAHRDLKPDNILISPDSGFYLVDFGFTRDTSDGQRSVSLTAKGTPAYMAPEIWKRGGDVDLMRADVYSAGKILHQILSGTPAVHFTDKLLAENPDDRPVSGIEILQLWKSSEYCPIEEPDWRSIAGSRVSGLLSVKLTLASKELLFTGRNDEAYWLLVESLEENAENAEALEMMSRFPQKTRKNPGIAGYGALASAVFAALAAAFLIGKESADDTGTGAAFFHGTQKVRSILSSDREIGAWSAVPLKQDSLENGLLSGWIAVDPGPFRGSLLVDNISYTDTSVIKNGIRLPKGEHDLCLVDSNGNRYWHRKVNLLPFQKKNIKIDDNGGQERK